MALRTALHCSRSEPEERGRANYRTCAALNWDAIALDTARLYKVD